ncbi:MAG: tetratricopeptide repeat protein [Planctomycetes bacterium]|nr:tetratricopeptide repeat protein [Planctomycetota bacterium]
MQHKHIFKAAAVVMLAGVVPALAFDADTILRAKSRQFDVTYSVNESAAPLSRVELWRRHANADAWEHFGNDKDWTSPMGYLADEEGLHELFFVLTNAAGTSGPPPQRDTIPHLRVFVDDTPPLIQLQQVKVFSDREGQPLVRFEWSAMDKHLTERPIRITYRQENEAAWKNAKVQLPNTGLYEWSAPADVAGEVMFRITVTDRGGNISSDDSESQQIAHGSHDLPKPLNQGSPPAKGHSVALADEATGPHLPLSAADQHRANQLLKSGLTFQENRNHPQAIQKFQGALAIDPQHTDALVNLGRSLYALGRYDEATDAFQSALAQSPRRPGALSGLADTFIESKQMGKAESKLLELLETGRGDASTWLRLGDVSAFKGRELAAHDYYVKAATSESAERSVTERAKARLADLFTNAKTNPMRGHRENERN